MALPAIAGTTATKPMALALGVAPDCAVELAIRTNSRDVMEVGVIGSAAVYQSPPGPTFGTETHVGGKDVT